MCDVCGLWLHTRCIGLGGATNAYSKLSHSPTSPSLILSYFTHCQQLIPILTYISADHEDSALIASPSHRFSVLHSNCSNSIPGNDINSLWSQWYDFYMTVTSKTVPLKWIKISNNLPFLNNDLMKTVRRKALLFRQAQRLGTVRAWSKKTQVRNKVT